MSDQKVESVMPLPPASQQTLPQAAVTSSAPVTLVATPGKRTNHRRHSLRSIKRKRFDDELVESSLQSRGVKSAADGAAEETQESAVSPTSALHVSPANVSAVSEAGSEPMVPERTASAIMIVGKKIQRSSLKTHFQKRKNLKKTQQAFAAVKDMGRWKPTDDILLIDAVESLGTLSSAYVAVKFSCRFTIEEVQERWYALLYDPVISSLARQAVKTLPREVVKATHARAPLSKAEEGLLYEVNSSEEPTLSKLQSLIFDNPSVFRQERTPESLLRHWSLMRQYQLLKDQKVLSQPLGDRVLNFSDAEDLLDDATLDGPEDHVLNSELTLTDRRQKREIKQLEEEGDRWKVLVMSVADHQPMSQFDEQTVAILQGRLVRYLMRSKEITIGRCSSDVVVDVDLSLEGPAFEVSRNQGLIKLKKTGEFSLSNTGKRPFIVDSKPVPTGCKCRLNQDSVIELGLLRFVFVINQEFVKAVTSSAKSAT